MKRPQNIHLATTGLVAASLAGAVLAITGCADQPPDHEDEVQSAATDGSTTPISRLPFIDASANTQLLGELLDKQTPLGETTALQVLLPPPHNQELAGSLVRVVGETASPHALFRSDALAQLGLIPKSPGKDFFTAFVTLPPEELDQLRKNQDEIGSGVFGKPTNESVLFSGRSAVARTINPQIDPGSFRQPGIPVPINRCFLRPVSTLQAWGQSLFITSPQVVLDPARTWDPCTGAGTQGGAWTFAHFMREMSIGSGKTPEQFVTDWLSLWLNSYPVNSDTVPARTQMFSQVIQPWAAASGVTATLFTNPFTGFRSVILSGPLNLNIAPYRLEAIVNRIDLGETSTGGGGLYGSVTGSPTTAGELRFIFGVVQPNPWGGGSEATCGRKLFTTIFEYGVPRTGCSSVVDWARQWTGLQAFPGFTPGYLAQLQSMTESVVLHGAAPAKGNQNAINQIRTNEIALSAPWELREFTLTDENPAAGTDSPSDGELRVHTVAQTPNDGAFSAAGADPTINAFVLGPVTAGLQLPVGPLPNNCASSYTVPYSFGGLAFRGGNALVGPPTGINFWRANSVPVTPEGICARHLFSFNTCHGCHHNDSGTNGGTSTNFVHIDPLSSIPVTLSKFLTGGGPGLLFNVNDTQFAPPTAPPWQFADLERRFQRLFDISHCTSCARVFPSLPILIDRMATFGPIPVDIDPRSRPDLKIGPITDLGTVMKVFDLRAEVAGQAISQPVDFLRQAQAIAE